MLQKECVNFSVEILEGNKKIGYLLEGREKKEEKEEEIPMATLVANKGSFSEFLNQVFFSVQEELLALLKEALERELEHLRDRIIGTRRYCRGNVWKRWGYTVRKYIDTPVGPLQNVRVPRIRGNHREVRLFVDRYVKRSGQVMEVLLGMFLWGMSTRKVSIMSQRLYALGLSPMGVSHLKDRLREKITEYRRMPISDDIEILVVDGVYGRFRKREFGAKGVCLVAIGVDWAGRARILDWQASDSESNEQWYKLFRRLYNRGLRQVSLLVSDDAGGAIKAAKYVWGEGLKHQLCLWHFCSRLQEAMVGADWRTKRDMRKEYWKLFDSDELEEAQELARDFVKKWAKNYPEIGQKFEEHWGKLFAFYQYPLHWRHRVRTVNLAEGFFSHLQTFLRRAPGWVDKAHVEFLLGLFVISCRAFRTAKQYLHLHPRRCPILFPNFNKIP